MQQRLEDQAPHYITLVLVFPFMERQSSPELRVVSPDSNQDTGTTFNTDDTDHSAMAAMVAHPNPSNMPGPANIGGVNKRYRPAPAKTFQCKGFGDCRMVFSRSEHLARHIRKHTGERPFTCHCSKQFSRLDNLRQHAQTVHADKQDQNERMMRELTSLHASMAAANKAGGRGGRRASGALSQQQSLPPAGSSPSSNGHSSPHHSPVSVNDGLNLIKEEDPTLSLHQRQDSQQYDANGLIYHNQTPSSWGVHGADSLHPRPSSRNGFRHDAADAFHSQSYLSYSPPLSFGLQGGDAPRSRPGTASGKGAHSLPPLSAIIPDQQEQSLHEYQQQQMAHQQQQQQGYVPSAIRPRPGTSSGRPPSSGASLFGPGTGPPKQQAGFYGDFNQRSYPSLGGYDTDSANSSSQDSNPFYFQHDDSSSTSGRSPSASSARSQSTALTPPANYQVPTSVSASRKRPFDGPDGPYNDLTYPSHPPPQQPGGGPFAYEYGSESRPQSRRLSVLELCNDGEATPGANSMLHADAMFGMNMNGLGGMGMNGINGLGVGVGVGGMNGFLEGRPTTAQIVSSASALAIFDGRDHSRSPSGSSVASAQHIGPGHHGGPGPDRRRASPAASTRSHGSGGRQSVRPDRPGRTTPPSRKVTPTVAAAGGAYSHASPAQGYHQPAHLSQQFSQPYSQPPYSSPYQNHANLNMNIPLGVYPSQASPTFSSASAASTPVTSFPSIQQQYLTGHHPHPQVQHLQQQHGRVGSPLSTSTQGASSPGPRSPGVPVSPFVGQSSFAMHQQQYLQQHQGGHGPYGQGF